MIKLEMEMEKRYGFQVLYALTGKRCEQSGAAVRGNMS
jgi:hypothetical protein